MRAKGYRYEAPELRRETHAGIARALAALAPSSFALPVSHAVVDQSITSSCVAQTQCRLAAVRADVLGLVKPYPSALFHYACSRMLESKGAPPPSSLPDRGSYPSLSCEAAMTVGFAPEASDPFDPHRVAELPAWDAYQAAQADVVQLGGYHWITQSGQDRVDAVRSAIASGYPVGVGMQVDAAFESHQGANIITSVAGPSFGGHAMPIVGYDDARGAVRLLNSWGLLWGDGGYAWLSYAVLASDGVDSCWALEVDR